jgi:hypothetical protein
MSVSQETLRAANSAEKEKYRTKDTVMKNASSRNEKPAWLITYENSIGTDSNLSNADEVDKGAIEALIPHSVAYSNLCPTHVKSYAIAGDWRYHGTRSHDALEAFYKNILNSSTFSLEKDAFYDNNDLQVSVTSQLGGISNPTRPQHDGGNIPDKSAVYFNVVHSVRLVSPFDVELYAELTSPQIQKHVLTVLESPDSKFADTIGMEHNAASQNISINCRLR